MDFKLYPHQEEALGHIRPGSILKGGVGSGKTLTSLAYYKRNFESLKLYVITTAKKRDSHDWEEEAKLLGIKDICVDSWNNIERYKQVYNALFIFDEQRVVGYGAWTKNFIAITKRNTWILLTATPGDNWSDYIPVFIANGFYKNKTQFVNEHIEYDRFVKFPKVKAYHNQSILFKYRDMITVNMDFNRPTTRHRKYLKTAYNRTAYLELSKKRWNIFKDKPIETPAELVQCYRRLVATDDDRIQKLIFLLDTIDRVIIFYNYTYELDLLKEVCEDNDFTYSEWNGRRHEEIPNNNRWVYLVQYAAGSEGWNCIDTDTIIFYSPNYSYKVTEQAEGRIDRLNTTFKHLEYIYLVSNSQIDKAVLQAIFKKKIFNEKKWSDKHARKRLPSIFDKEDTQAPPKVYSFKERP